LRLKFSLAVLALGEYLEVVAERMTDSEIREFDVAV